MARPRSALLVILIGIALLVGPFVIFPHAGQQECVNYVESIPGAEIPSNAEVMQYRDLSTEAKRALDKARAASDGRATVYGDRCPNEFRYTDYVGEYFIQSGDEYYTLETIAGGGLFPVPILYGIGFGLVAISLIALGGHSILRKETTQVQEFVYGGLAGLGVLLLILAAVDASFVLGLGLTLLAVVLAYGILGYDLPIRMAIGVSIVASVGVIAALIGFGFGFRGSITVVVLFPPVLTGLGIAGRVLRAELIP